MPIYVYRCKKCGEEFEQLVCHQGDIVIHRPCTRLEGGMRLVDGAWGERIPFRTAPSFTVSGFNAANGYSNDSGR